MAELNGIPADFEHVSALGLTNYGHFTSMRVDDGRVRGLSLHMQRLVRDCQRLFDTDLDAEWVRHLVRHALVDQPQPVIVRLTVFDPTLQLGHPGVEAEPNVLVTTRPAADVPQPPLQLRTVAYARDLPEVKHVGLFGTLRHRREAQRHGFDDALFVDRDSNITEAATSNVGFFDGAQIIWPAAAVLTGTTMSLIDDVHGGPSTTATINLADLGGMSAAFATNAAVGVRTIERIDGTRWTDEHAIVGVLRKEYADVPAEII